jgi:DNA-binding MarR family transcriptional regulator
MAERTQGKRALAAEVWRLMAGFTTDKLQSGGLFAAARELGLTPGHVKALGVLDPDEPKPMGALADALVCDASMVTWLVDRLEERGLVERRTLPTDRRVKTLILTPLGIETRNRLAKTMYEPPEALLELDVARLEALRGALRELPPPSRPFWTGSGERGSEREQPTPRVAQA